VTHFFSLSPKVGQPRQEYCAFSRGEIDNGSPGWIQTGEFDYRSLVVRAPLKIAIVVQSVVFPAPWA
jgi:hypothetical protein